ncbi:Mce family protein [Mycobacteroides abscessus subsp. bolletii]|uniref:Mce family protein n=3 Tax=Mycobacteroides abscessus TaxID=36809 RepID=A0A9Q7WKE9_9MYCO|nr:MlaD family protein [Mycobacteroides abscessus]EUA72257.1 mce related family protein [Mycobacteroides abscessus subsp. bolletii 1513]EIU09850.1 MCE-family protein Mce1B [Mycobacteroides abscessus 5S-0304]EIU17287.1 MCE-family protein Mce1B [Mycobacteroides abscessus 5S-0421]EIU19113.1 MCE-family protein Mce1B [Mycobacteroides abscessus 5S-0422]EIU25061.1 MCE-family protein Mce1B [Mycobacteroides abscessus 5S-0817]
MIKPGAALWRFMAASAFGVLILVLIVNVLQQPVAAETRSYTAEFTDVSGLHIDADVRVRGVRVGKVKELRLIRRGGQSLAEVDLSLDRRYTVVPATRLAIKYQALTGLRYLDVSNPAEQASGKEPVTHIPLSMTQPSFDITTLFNGLQPVLATLSPNDIDTFTENAASFFQGDGGGLGPMLESIHKLTEFVADRQQVIATLMNNLSAIADVFGGHSKELVQVLDWMNRPIDAAISVMDEFRKSELYGPGFTAAAVRLLHNAGFVPGKADMDKGIDRAITVFDDNSDAFKRVPVFWDNVEPPAEPGTPLPCSRGRAQLPQSMDVLLNGQRVILCNR